MTFENWKREVDVLMRTKYAIDSSDAGFDDNELRGLALARKARGLVSWFAEKYELTPKGIWGGTNISALENLLPVKLQIVGMRAQIGVVR